MSAPESVKVGKATSHTTKEWDDSSMEDDNLWVENWKPGIGTILTLLT
ncbi:hypothetical protein SLEP1_g36728 [Rubroshorea leprosula]|uniref:Uncharacterized protein n=1 Tax=Rubroshorea leprosula TaxID=152421 RepID=A0AAV5KSW6_9ROSI|nr:hypothetical protein SLEP1_g36728 [Rubroshorea leprosula]